jgi:hypothetical protein
VLRTQTVKLAEGNKDPVTIDLRPPSPPPGGGPWFLPGAITGGGGAALLLVGAITGGVAMAKVKDLQSKCLNHVCDGSLQGEQNTARTLANVSSATFVIGGVAAAVGVTLLVVRRPKRPRTGDTFGMRLGMGRIEVEGSF